MHSCQGKKCVRLILRGADTHLYMEGGVDKAVVEAGPETPLLSLFLPLSRGKEYFPESHLQQVV